ncbi:MAG: hypothetical protein K8F91_27070, partial [Candidatus Obscuribacterales bacterium]|nr:hypothetical protein [Candidatus Obscuribacterales bacterium]
MNDQNDLPIIDKILSVTVRSETAQEEEILWSQRPDSNSMAVSLLACPLLWLAGLFLFAIGVLKTSHDYQNKVLHLMIFILVLVAVMGVIEIVAIPHQAKKAIYVVTNLRTFIIKLRGKFGYAGMSDYSIVSRKLVREEKSTLFFYYLYTVPLHLLFAYLVVDLILGLVREFDIFTICGFALITSGWMLQWYQDMRFPIPRFRDCPRAFYFINEWLASVETIEHKAVEKAYLHKGKTGTGDIFLVA